MDVQKIKELIVAKGGQPALCPEEDLTFFRSVMHNPEVRDLLVECNSFEGYHPSEINMGGDLEGLVAINRDLAPGGYLFPMGFVSFATSIGGNQICVDANTGKVYFADHGSFYEDKVVFKDREAGQWRTVHGLNYENALKGLIFLSDDLETFLIRLHQDELTEELDELD